jgi:hypothetical protein
MKGGKLRLKGAKRISIKRLRQLARESKRLYRLHTKDANTHVVEDQCDNEDDVDDHHGDDQEQCDKQDEEDEEGTISSEHANTHVDFQDLCDNEDDVLFFF